MMRISCSVFQTDHEIQALGLPQFLLFIAFKVVKATEEVEGGNQP